MEQGQNTSGSEPSLETHASLPTGRFVIFLLIITVAAVLMVIMPSPSPLGVSMMGASGIVLTWDHAVTAPLTRSNYWLLLLVTIATVGGVILGKIFWPDLEWPGFERAIRHPATAATLWIVQAAIGFRMWRQSTRRSARLERT